jgi:hypothetical protein
LVVAAVLRDYRCKDWRFAAVARTVNDEAFKTRVHRLREPDEFTQRLASVGADVVSLRAEFLLFLFDNPTVAIKRQSWARWRDTQNGVVKHGNPGGAATET